MAWSRTVSLLGTFLIFSIPHYAMGATTSQQSMEAANSETQFRSWIQSLSVDGTKVSTGDQKYDRATDILTVKNFVLSSSAPTAQSETQRAAGLTIGTLTLKAFSSNSEGTRAGSAIADDVVISAPGRADGAPVRISRFEISGGFVPSLLTFTADPARPVTSQIRLLRLLSKANFDAVTADKLNLAAFFSIDQVQFGKISAGRISDGKLSKLLTVLPAVADTATNDQTQRTASVDTITFKNLDLDAYMRLFETSAYLGAGSARPWSNFVEEVSLTGAKWETGPVAVGVDAATLGPLKIRQFEESITDIFDSSARDPAYLTQNADAAAKLSNSLRGAFAFEAASVRGVTLRMTNQAGVTTANLKSASVANLMANHVDRLQFEAFNVADSAGSVDIQKLGLLGINLQSDATAAQVSAQRQEKLPTIDEVTAEGMKLHIGQMNAGFDSMDLAMSYFIGSTPTNIKAALEHVKFPVSQIVEPGARQTLTDLGYKDIDLSFKLSGAWQDSASTVAFDTIEIKGVDMGTLSLSGSLTGISRASFENPVQVFPREALAGGLQNLRITFENASLFDRFIAQIAKQNNKSVDELKQLLSSNMPAIMAKIASPQIRNKFILAAVSFINNPKILQLLTTTSDVTMIKDVMASLPEPYNLPVILKLDASANERK